MHVCYSEAERSGIYGVLKAFVVCYIEAAKPFVVRRKGNEYQQSKVTGTPFSLNNEARYLSWPVREVTFISACPRSTLITVQPLNTHTPLQQA